MACWGIILAAGQGSRLAAATSGIAKQFLEWQDRPLYWHSAMAMSRSCCIDGIIFVFPEQKLADESEKITALARTDTLGLAWKAVAGGSTRQESSVNGVSALPSDCDKVLIHDAARCFATPALFRNICATVSPERPGVIPVLPVTDTVKLASEEDPNRVCATLPRALLAAAQTPQGFHLSTLREAMANACGSVTDDASLLEQAGFSVHMIEGESGNIKITTAADLACLKQDREISCTGFGYDAHRFGPGRPLKLGGVPIPGEWQVIAHSDGDVLLHSLMDALLGCAGLGDIGQHFPDASREYEGISSAILLDHVLALLHEHKTRPVHIDMTVVAQKPKLAPYAGQIRKNVARLMQMPLQTVNFKATTEEKMGFTGRLEGIKAYAIANAVRYG